jgi:transmembrane 9 superfamily member 2/4
LNNHLKFTLQYHTETNDAFRVVGFEIEAQSVDNKEIKISEDGESCEFVSKTAAVSMAQVLSKTNPNLQITYEVVWEKSDTPWASRWDSYLKMSDVKIHWFSIINSLIVVFFLAGILSMIIVRSLRRDIAKYNREDEPVKYQII